MLNATELKKIQSLQLKIAKEFKRICDNYNISYSLSGGTLLGAVRHSGFIPWDDDFDVEMLRSEYERFLRIAPRELGSEYFLETWKTDKHYSLPYAKLMLKGTIYSEKATEHVNIKKGIFIDIFVADFISDKSWLKKVQCNICDKLFVILCDKNRYQNGSFRKGLKKICYDLASSLIPLTCLKKLLKFFMTIFNKTTAKDTSLFGSCYGSKKEIKSKDFYYNLKEYIFENTNFTGFADYDTYLRSLYGNYMEFPPEKERYNRHSIIKIDFGNY